MSYKNNKIHYINTFFVIFISFCSKKGKSLVIPFSSNTEPSTEAKTYITNSTVTPPLFDFSNESSLPVDFGGNVSAVLDVPDLQYVDRFKALGILFSTMMNKSSVQNAFTLKDSSNQIIEGTFYWSGSKLYFKTYHPLNPKEAYTITITTNAKNFDGNSLESDFVQSFTTNRLL